MTSISATRPARATLWLGSLLLFTTFACTKKKEEETKADAKAEAPQESKSEHAGTAPTSPPPTPPKPVEAPKAVTTTPARIPSGGALAHLIVPKLSGFLVDIKDHATPTSMSAFLGEPMLRAWAGAALEDRGAIAQHFDSNAPMGCVLIDSAKTDFPLACLFGYQGGATAFATDLGTLGKEADAKGHAAFYKLDGNDMFIDELDGHVVISTHTEVLSGAQAYLRGTLLARAPKLDRDLEVIAFAAPAFKRYEAELTALFKDLTPAVGGGGDSLPQNMLGEYAKTANAEAIEQWKGTEEVRFALGLDGNGLVVDWDAFPLPGSKTEALYKSFASGPFDAALAKKLPGTVWAVLGVRMDGDVLQAPALQSLKKAIVAAYAKELGQEAAPIEVRVDEYVRQWHTLHGPNAAAGLMHLPGTAGGLVYLAPLQGGASGRDAWQALVSGLNPKDVLGEATAAKITWTFTKDAATHAGAAIDRWTFEPTAAGKAELLEKGGPSATTLEKATAGFKFAIDRTETGGHVVFTLVAGDPTLYTQAAIDAIAGTGNLSASLEFAKVVERATGASSVTALDVQGAANWLRALLPPDEAAKIPESLGVDLTDVVGTGRWSTDGGSSTQLHISAPFIDRLRKLADPPSQ